METRVPDSGQATLRPLSLFGEVGISMPTRISFQRCKCHQIRNSPLLQILIILLGTVAIFYPDPGNCIQGNLKKMDVRRRIMVIYITSPFLFLGIERIPFRGPLSQGQQTWEHLSRGPHEVCSGEAYSPYLRCKYSAYVLPLNSDTTPNYPVCNEANSLAL